MIKLGSSHRRSRRRRAFLSHKKQTLKLFEKVSRSLFKVPPEERLRSRRLTRGAPTRRTARSDLLGALWALVGCTAGGNRVGIARQAPRCPLAEAVAPMTWATPPPQCPAASGTASAAKRRGASAGEAGDAREPDDVNRRPPCVLSTCSKLGARRRVQLQREQHAARLPPTAEPHRGMGCVRHRPTEPVARQPAAAAAAGGGGSRPSDTEEDHRDPVARRAQEWPSSRCRQEEWDAASAELATPRWPAVVLQPQRVRGSRSRRTWPGGARCCPASGRPPSSISFQSPEGVRPACPPGRRWLPPKMTRNSPTAIGVARSAARHPGRWRSRSRQRGGGSRGRAARGPTPSPGTRRTPGDRPGWIASPPRAPRSAAVKGTGPASGRGRASPGAAAR